MADGTAGPGTEPQGDPTVMGRYHRRMGRSSGISQTLGAWIARRNRPPRPPLHDHRIGHGEVVKERFVGPVLIHPQGIAIPVVRVLLSGAMQKPMDHCPETLLPPHPALNAMLICDLALQEQVTGKTSLVGIFETVSAYQFPARHGFLSVYVKLTDVQGDYRLRLEFVQLDELKVVGQGQLRATFADRMAPAELVFQIGDIVFERQGRYEFRLYANDRWVGSKSLNVHQASEPRPQLEQIRVSGSTVTVRWLAFMLPAPRHSAEAM